MPNKYEVEETKTDVSLEEQHFPGVRSCAQRDGEYFVWKS